MLNGIEPIKLDLLYEGNLFVMSYQKLILKKEFVMDLRYFKYTNNFIRLYHRILNENTLFIGILSKNQLIILLYKRFLILITSINLQRQYVIQPYSVGKEKRSLAMVIPAEIVKSLKIDPLSIFLLLKISGKDDLHLKVLRRRFSKKRNRKGYTCGNKCKPIRSELM